MNKPIAIVLGGTNPHIALIENLKQRGYHTVLIDYYENPPAKAFADQHIQESTLDKEKVLSIAQQLKADLVISACIDHANVTACYVAGKLGLPAPYSYETALNVSDKTLMKKKMLEAGIPTAKFLCISDMSDLKTKELTFPLVVKPADSNSSKGVKKVNNLPELDLHIKNALQISRSKKAVIEEYVEGFEISADCLVSESQGHILMMHRKRKPHLDGNVMFSIGSVSPPDLSPKVKNKVNRILNSIIEVFQLNNTPILIQAIVNNDDVSVIEFAPRVGGGLNFRKIKLYAGCDIINVTVDSFLGYLIGDEYKNYDCYVSENHVYTYPGIFGKITGFEQLIKRKVIEEIYFNKTKGMEFLSDLASTNRAASFFVKGKSKDELQGKIRTAFDSLHVYDIKGVDIMRRDIYTDLLI